MDSLWISYYFTFHWLTTDESQELQILLFHLPLTYHWRIKGTPNLTISPSIDLPLTNHRDSKSYYFTFHWLTTDESQGLQILLFHLPLTYHWRITGTPNLTISPSIDLPLTNHRDSKSCYFNFQRHNESSWIPVNFHKSV
jgi:hypothetical protein